MILSIDSLGTIINNCNSNSSQDSCVTNACGAVGGSVITAFHYFRASDCGAMSGMAADVVNIQGENRCWYNHELLGWESWTCSANQSQIIVTTNNDSLCTMPKPGPSISVIPTHLTVLPVRSRRSAAVRYRYLPASASTASFWLVF